MKSATFIFTILVQFLLLLLLKLLDSCYLLVLINIGCIAISWRLRSIYYKDTRTKKIATGIFYGALVSLLSLVLFAVWYVLYGSG